VCRNNTKGNNEQRKEERFFAERENARKKETREKPKKKAKKTGGGKSMMKQRKNKADRKEFTQDIFFVLFLPPVIQLIFSRRNRNMHSIYPQGKCQMHEELRLET
jgi:hypothetical protein|tara:strand:+ start:192 stop:506 length:315 start_codon:yes stop_codon:yes gene_type:complete